MPLLDHIAENIENLRFITTPLGCMQSQYPRLVVEDFTPLPSKGQTGKDGWYVLYFSLVQNIDLYHYVILLIVH